MSTCRAGTASRSPAGPAERLPAGGIAIDLCTGSGAIAKALAVNSPGARVVASDIDERAVACAVANGVEAYHGDLFAPLPRGLAGCVDVVVAVVPYVPTRRAAAAAARHVHVRVAAPLRRGRDGTDILRRVLAESPRFLRDGGAVLLELGGDQAAVLAGDLDRIGYVGVSVLADEEGDVRGIEATLPGAAS